MIVTIDIGGTKLRISYSRVGDKLEESIIIPTPHSQRSVIATITTNIQRLIGSRSVDAIGISCPGPIDLRRGMVLSPKNLHWRNLKIVAPLEKAFHCPVVLEHDATAGGIAEARLGAGKKHRLVVYVTWSTGIGTAILLDGNPLPSPHNSEGGHQIIELSTKPEQVYEDIISGKDIVRRFGHRAADIYDKPTWHLIAHDMSVGIYNLMTIVQPDCIILGGGVAVHYRRFITPLTKELKRFSNLYPLPPIHQAKFVETAPSIGAMLRANEILLS